MPSDASPGAPVQPAHSSGTQRKRFSKRTAGTIAGALCVALLAAGLWYSWSNYFDGEYNFHMPLPFGWRANGYTVSFYGSDRCGHEVDLIPPATQGIYLESPPGNVGAEMITVFIPISCAGWSQFNEQRLGGHVRTIMVSGKPATLYSYDDGHIIDRMAVARFGGHEFDISFHCCTSYDTPASQAKAELALFMNELRGFTYDGG